MTKLSYVGADLDLQEVSFFVNNFRSTAYSMSPHVQTLSYVWSRTLNIHTDFMLKVFFAGIGISTLSNSCFECIKTNNLQLIKLMF